MKSTHWPLDACFAAVGYAFPWQTVVIDMKFHEQSALTSRMAKLMLANDAIAHAVFLADVIVGIPLAQTRLVQRGFNQAALLARQLDTEKTPVHGLVRRSQAAAQTQLNRIDRQKNMVEAFAVDPLLVANFSGKRVLLVDDVMTTGSTLAAAARAVRAAGASHVSAAVFARTDASS